MRTLDKKLVRDMRRLWAQSLAIALLLGCGVAILVLSFGTQRSLTETQQTFYERNRFADVFASAVRAPETLRAEIEAIPGVSIVQTRITKFALLDIEGLREPAMGQFLSLPDYGEAVLNLPRLVEGRMPAPNAGDEIVINLPFAEANGFHAGDTLDAILN
ncbi:MAG TPA: ABC transporter permease, partial [Paracoccaceae bacterium]|nr:ABC transporter permease [Paracoccaceae bacterium]